MFLVHRVPYPPNRGDRIRSYHILKYLSEVADVSLATLADEPVEPATRQILGSLAKRVAIERVGKGRWVRGAISLASGKSATEGLFRSPRLRHTVRDWSREIRWDAVIVFCSSMMQYTEIPELAGVPVIVDLVDVDSQKFFDYANLSRGPKRWLYGIEGRRLRHLECSMPSRARVISLVSEAEAQLYRNICANDRTVSIPNGVDLEYFRSQGDGRCPWKPLPVADHTDLVFVGALDYRANVDGVVWFVRHVWPLVRQAIPTLTLAIVGRNPVAAVRQLAHSPGVRLFANVSDVRPHIAGARIAIAPLRVARGVQNKVLEALAMGKPVVATPEAIEGLPAVDAPFCLAARTPSDWVHSLRLLSDQTPADHSIAIDLGREFVEYCDWRKQISKFLAHIDPPLHSAGRFTFQSPGRSLKPLNSSRPAAPVRTL